MAGWLPRCVPRNGANKPTTVALYSITAPSSASDRLRREALIEPISNLPLSPPTSRSVPVTAQSGVPAHYLKTFYIESALLPLLYDRIQTNTIETSTKIHMPSTPRQPRTCQPFPGFYGRFHVPPLGPPDAAGGRARAFPVLLNSSCVTVLQLLPRPTRNRQLERRYFGRRNSPVRSLATSGN